MVGEIYDNYIAPIQESIERLKKAIQALDKRLSNEILRINSLASSSVSDGKTLTALEEWRKTHEEWTDKQIKDLLEGIDKKLDFDEKIEALESVLKKWFQLHLSLEKITKEQWLKEIRGFLKQLERYKEEDEWLEGK